MDSIRYLISFFIKVAFAFFVAAIVWWLVSLFSPSLSLHSLLANRTGTSTEGWLPSPRKYSGLLGQRAPVQNENTNVYKPGVAFNGYGVNDDQYTYSTYNYVTYTASGTVTTKGEGSVSTTNQQNGVSSNNTSNTVSVASNPNQGVVGKSQTSPIPTQAPTALLNNRSLTVRNLSIYEGGHLYTGLSFIGEAKENMFRDGKFPIVVVDAKGKVIGISAAIATTNWTIPGWVRFETKITYALPVNMPCTIVFEEALTQGERATRQPLRVPLQARCN